MYSSLLADVVAADVVVVVVDDVVVVVVDVVVDVVDVVVVDVVVVVVDDVVVAADAVETALTHYLRWRAGSGRVEEELDRRGEGAGFEILQYSVSWSYFA